MNFIQKLYNSIITNSDRRAFCVNDKYISYAEFQKYINGTSELLRKNLSERKKPIAIIAYDSLETYAAIFATWVTGNYFIPINPKHPVERNMKILKETGTQIIFSSSQEVGNVIDIKELTVLNNSGLISDEHVQLVSVEPNQNLYVITTSGSSGTPKYVPIHVENVDAYCTGFLKLFPELDENCKFLQTYDLTSDAAFTGYLLPLLVGGCVYTVPTDGFKFLSIAKLLAKEEINWVKFTPSVLIYLTPYISRLNFPHIKHVIFGGEALPIELVKSWRTVFPEAYYSNLYGPTETTISATTYRFKEPENAKSIDGIVSIGKSFPQVECELIDKSGSFVIDAGIGELCIAGQQTMEGYLLSDSKVFIMNNDKKFYRTGDFVQRDEEGFLYFLGRIDDQVKIDGYRVNLMEVENCVRSLVPDNNIVVVVQEKMQGLKRLYVFLEKYDGDVDLLEQKLSKQLPKHMMPEELISVPNFLYTTSGKIDKKSLEKQYIKPE